MFMNQPEGTPLVDGTHFVNDGGVVKPFDASEVVEPGPLPFIDTQPQKASEIVAGYKERIEHETQGLVDRFNALEDEKNFLDSGTDLLPLIANIIQLEADSSKLIETIRLFLPLIKEKIVAEKYFDVGALTVLFNIGNSLEKPLQELLAKALKKRERALIHAASIENSKNTEIVAISVSIQDLLAMTDTAFDSAVVKAEYQRITNALPLLRTTITEKYSSGIPAINETSTANDWIISIIDNVIFLNINTNLSKIQSKIEGLEGINSLEQKINELLSKSETQTNFEISTQRNEVEEMLNKALIWLEQLKQYSGLSPDKMNALHDKIYYSFYKTFNRVLHQRVEGIETTEKSWDDLNEAALLRRAQNVVEEKTGVKIEEFKKFLSQYEDVREQNLTIARQEFNDTHGTDLSERAFIMLVHAVTVEVDFFNRKFLHLSWTGNRAVIMGDNGGVINYPSGNEFTHPFPRIMHSYILDGILKCEFSTSTNEVLQFGKTDLVEGVETIPGTKKLRPKVMKKGDQYGVVEYTFTANDWFWRWFDRWADGQKKHVPVTNADLANKSDDLITAALADFYLEFPDRVQSTRRIEAVKAFRGWAMNYHQSALSSMSDKAPNPRYYMVKLTRYNKTYFRKGMAGWNPRPIIALYGSRGRNYKDKTKNPIPPLMGQSPATDKEMRAKQGLLSRMGTSLLTLVDSDLKYEMAKLNMNEKDMGWLLPEGASPNYIQDLLDMEEWDPASLSAAQKAVIERYKSTGLTNYGFLFEPPAAFYQDQVANQVFTLSFPLFMTWLRDEMGKTMEYVEERNSKRRKKGPISVFQVRSRAKVEEDPVTGLEKFIDTGDVLYGASMRHGMDSIGVQVLDATNLLAVTGNWYLNWLKNPNIIESLIGYAASDTKKNLGYSLPFLPNLGRWVGAGLHVDAKIGDPTYKLDEALIKIQIMVAVFTILCHKILTDSNAEKSSALEKSVEQLGQLVSSQVLTPDEASAMEAALRGAYTGYNAVGHASASLAKSVEDALLRV